MHQLASPIQLRSYNYTPFRKEVLTDEDFEVVADFVLDNLHDGLYPDIVIGYKRSEVVEFLRQLTTRGEIEEYDSAKKCFIKRGASLQVYADGLMVVGYSVLAQSRLDSTTNGVDLVMFGVDPRQRGVGYGSLILDSIIKEITLLKFGLNVKCWANNHVLFMMLATRGFTTVGRLGKAHLLRLAPSRSEQL